MPGYSANIPRRSDRRGCFTRENAYKRPVRNTWVLGWWLNGGPVIRQDAVRNNRVPASRVSALDRHETTLFLHVAIRHQEQSLRLSAGIQVSHKRKKGKATMALYEHVFLARQDVSAQQVEALVEHYKGVLEANGGSVGRVESWGLKSLTYRINKNRKAHYTLMDINAPAAAVHEMERQMRINEDVLRYMTIAVEEHEDGPSAMMQKRDRDDRPRGGDRGDRGDRGPREGGFRDDRGPRGDREDRPRRPREDRV